MSARETVCAVLLFQQIRQMFHSSFWKIDSSAGLEDSSHNNWLHMCNNCLYILDTKQCSLGSEKKTFGRILVSTNLWIKMDCSIPKIDVCKLQSKQECIPVGCVSPAAVAVGRGRGRLHQAPPRTMHPPGPCTPPVDRHTPVNILPCPKLRLRAVITIMQFRRWGSQL